MRITVYIILFFHVWFLSAQDLNFTLADVDQSIDLSIGVLSKETYNPTFFLNKNFSEETTEALQSKFYLAESNNLNQNKGLYIKFRANYNFRDDYDEDLNGYLKGSVRGELEWRFFEEGLIDYKNQSKISLAKSKLYDFRSTEANSERGTQFLGFYIRQMINFEEKQILLEELKSYNLLFDVCSNLFSQRLISRNQLIDLGYKISNIEIQLDVLVNENIDYERITKIDSDFDLILPFFQIDFSQIQFDTYSDEEELMNDIVEFEEKSVNNYRLALYVSENYTFSESQSNLFPSAGIRFTVPLRSNNRKERIELKKSVNSSEIREKRVNQKLQRGAIYKSFSFNNAELSRLVEEQDILIDQIRVKTLLNSELKSEAVDLELVQLKFRQFDLLKSLLRIKEEQYLNLVELYGIFNLDIPEHAISEYYPKSSLNMSIVHFSESDAFDFDFQFSYLISIGARQICVEDNDTQAANYLRENDTEFFIDRCTKYVSIEKLIRQDMKTLKLEF